MSLINDQYEEDKTKMMEWARENFRPELFKNSNNELSYYQQYNSEDMYIMAYQFETISDIERSFENMTNNSLSSNFSRWLAVCIIKHKTELDEENAVAYSESIPEYIYVF